MHILWSISLLNSGRAEKYVVKEIPHSHYNILNLGIFSYKNSYPTTYQFVRLYCISERIGVRQAATYKLRQHEMNHYMYSVFESFGDNAAQE